MRERVLVEDESKTALFEARDDGMGEMSAGSNRDHIPSELKKLPQWVLWRYETRAGGKGSKHKTKVPCQADGRRSSSTDPKTWYSFESAAASLSNNPDQFAGIGFVFANDPYCGIDLDNSLNQDGSPKPWAEEIIRNFQGAYMEVSPSGRGIKIWAKGKLSGPGKQVRINDIERVEIYDTGRFFAVTTQVYCSPVEAIGDHQAEIDQLYVRLVRTRASGAGARSSPSRSVIVRAG